MYVVSFHHIKCLVTESTLRHYYVFLDNSDMALFYLLDGKKGQGTDVAQLPVPGG
jgi:hypothetical protein